MTTLTRPGAENSQGLAALRQQAEKLRHQVTGDKAGTDDRHRN